MTTEEVRHEMQYDFMAVHRRAMAMDKVVWAEMERKKITNGMKVIEFQSARKTEWTILYRLKAGTLLHVYYTEASGSRGRVAYQFAFDNTRHENGIIKYTTHFFQRYRERQQPHLNNPSEIIRHFFRHNMDCRVGRTERQDDENDLAGFVMVEGMGLGWLNNAKRIAHVNTYLPHHMLNDKQQSIADLFVLSGDEFRVIKTPKQME